MPVAGLPLALSRRPWYPSRAGTCAWTSGAASTAARQMAARTFIGSPLRRAQAGAEAAHVGVLRVGLLNGVAHRRRGRLAERAGVGEDPAGLHLAAVGGTGREGLEDRPALRKRSRGDRVDPPVDH